MRHAEAELRVKSRWLMLAAGCLAYFAFGFVLQSAPPVLPLIMSEYGASYTVASNLMFLVGLAPIILSIPGGILVDRYGVRIMGSIGLAVLTVGVFLCTNPPFYSALEFGRLISGIGGAFIFISATALLAQWFAGKAMGLAMGLFSLSMPLSTVAAFNTLDRVGQVHGWRAAFWISFLVVAVALVFYGAYSRQRLAPARSKLSFSGLRNLQIWILGLVWAAFNIACFAYLTWSKVFFMEFKSVQPDYASLLASMLMIGALLTPLTGYVSDRLRRRRALILASSLVMAATLFVIPSSYGSVLLSVVIILGLGGAFLPPAVFALPEAIIGVEKSGLGFGVLNACGYAGVAIGPVIAGLVMDLTYSEAAVFSTMGIFAVLTLLFGILLKAR